MRPFLLLASLILSSSLLWAQSDKADVVKSSGNVYGQLAVTTSPEMAWKAITENYGHVGNHHRGIKYAYILKEQVPSHHGTIRHSQLNRTAYTKESIIAYDEGNKTYTTFIYEASQNVLPILRQKVGIKQENGQTYVYQKITYSPKVSRQDMGRIKKWNKAYLKAYKEVIEEMMPKEPKAKQIQLRVASMLYE